MSRKKRVFKKRDFIDHKYQDEWVGKLIHKVMESGKKTTAEKIVYGAFEKIEKKSKTEALNVFRQAVENLKPLLEVRSRRVGGATYQVPIEVRAERRLSLSLRWLVDYSRQRKMKGMTEKLASEILDASQQKGEAYKKKDSVHRMAESNKAFSHYNW